MIWHFGGFEYREKAGLFHAGEAVPLGRQAGQLLELLLAAKGGVVGRAEIAAKVWPKRSISEDSIDRCVYLLRKTFREQGADDLVATAYGRGVWLTAKIELAEPQQKPPHTAALAHDHPPKQDMRHTVTDQASETLEVTVGDISIRVGPEVQIEELLLVIKAAIATKLTSLSHGR